MKRFVVCLSAIALLGLYGGEARAQTGFGAHASFASESDLGIGARAMFEAPVERLTIVPSLDIFFPSSGVSGVTTRWIELNGNVHYAFPLSDTDAPYLPYAGGGLSLMRYSVSYAGFSGSETELGLNLVGGVNFLNIASFVPFAELRFNTVGSGQLILTGGINF